MVNSNYTVIGLRLITGERVICRVKDVNNLREVYDAMTFNFMKDNHGNFQMAMQPVEVLSDDNNLELMYNVVYKFNPPQDLITNYLENITGLSLSNSGIITG